MIVDVRAARNYRCRVLLDGEDVSDRCFYADDQAGIVDLYALDEKGKRYAIDEDLATERRAGAVKIVMPEEVAR